MNLILSPLIRPALERAAAQPAGVPLVGTRGAGLFPASAAGKQAAQDCKDHGLVQVVGQKKRGRAVQELCTASDLGRRWLLEAFLLQILEDWEDRPSDCPLPELYRTLPGSIPSIGGFHDALRRMHEHGRIWLHPWTGPLHDMPEPMYAPLSGHEVAYYASLRR